jgi:hypothetical protein
LTLAATDRRPRDAVLSVRVHGAALDRLDVLASAAGVGRSEMARRLMARAIAGDPG